MIYGPFVFHFGTDENGLFCELGTYEEVDTSFIEEEDREIRAILEGGGAQ